MAQHYRHLLPLGQQFPCYYLTSSMVMPIGLIAPMPPSMPRIFAT